MLCAKRTSDNQSVIARDESKSNAPFVCPECGKEVTLRKCVTRIDHFAHKPPVTCTYGAGETEIHRRCKMAVYESLLKETGVAKAALERSLQTCRPDVSAYINGVPVAIEVQISTLSLEVIFQRTVEYARRGIYVLWLLQWTPKLDDKRYSPRLWEKWVHATYFGRVYYWIEGLTVACYHFEPHKLWVPDSSWYSDTGVEMSAGGYHRQSKRYRTAVRRETLHLVKHFGAKERAAWESKELKIPAAKLFMHS